MKWGDEGLSALLLGGYLGMLTLLWGAMTAGVGSWRKRHALPSVEDGALVRVSICIPARDEAHQIAECVQAALHQDIDVEVIVVDDGSTDGTGDVARSVAPGDVRLHVVRNAPPPTGWAGKPWACQRAAAEASGAALLFVDADVVLAPDAARRAVSVLLDRRLSLLSVFGSWRLESFWENVAIPVVGWFIRGATDIRAVNAPGRPEAFANGQFILFDRAAYDALGGHAAVKGEVLEDVRIARAAKRRGQAIGLYAAPELFRVRLYRSLGEILRGYGKNFYEGMDRRPLIALGALLFLFVGAGLPWVLLGIAAALPALVFTGLEPRWLWAAWIVLVCVLPILFRWRVERVDGRSGWYAWTHPIGNVILGVILLRAIVAVETTWKGRRFHDGRAADG